MRIALMFECFGAYHRARLRAARERLDIVGVEVSPTCSHYAWIRSEPDATKVRLFERGIEELSSRDLRRKLFHVLDEIDPQIVACPGWSAPFSLLAVAWCAKRRRLAIMMSDSTEQDLPRRALREALKRLILSGCSSALVSGSRSARYLKQLGFPKERVSLGFDVVDDAHFSVGAARAQADGDDDSILPALPKNYILSVCRLAPEKNTMGLLEGYAIHRRIAGDKPCNLVIVGDGPERASLEMAARRMGLERSVRFLGHVAYEELPRIYGFAKAFVLASTSEPWGLVLNEALACGLPIAASHRCGAVEDLVIEGVNGHLFDPQDANAIATALGRISSAPSSFGEASLRLSLDWTLDRFTTGLSESIEIARRTARPPSAAIGALSSLLAHGADFRS